MALYGDVTHDSRVLREAASLSDAGYKVQILCLSGTPPPDASFEVVARAPSRSTVLPGRRSPFIRELPTGRLGRLASQLSWMLGYVRNLRSWGRWAVSSAGAVDVWHAHDLTGLMAIAPFLPEGTKLVYDSHEIFLEAGTALRLPGPMRKLLAAYERLLVRRSFALITVNEDCAEVLDRRLQPRRTVIVRNCPPRFSPSPEAVPKLREAARVPENQTVLLYHGALTRSRGIEEVAQSLLEPGMDGLFLVLLGFDPAEEITRLAHDERFGGRVRFAPAVPPQELLTWVTSADVNVIAQQRSTDTRRVHVTLNQWLSTPNKLWESIAAGVPVVASDFPAMRRVVLDNPEGPLGEVCDPADPVSIALAVRRIIELPEDARAELRKRCLTAAHARWNWETEALALLDLYGSMVPGGPSAEPAHEPIGSRP